MTEKPLVSVIIPTYNRGQSVCRAVDSVLAQEGFRDFELIVVDDGSTDDTARRLGSFGNALTPLRLEHGGAPGRARNAGASAAQGQYLAFLDSDDLWLPEKLKRQMPSLLAGARICHTRELWLRRGREISQAGQRHRREGDIFEEALVKCIIGPSTAIVEKSFFDSAGGFREDLFVAEDYELWLKLCFASPVAYLDEALTIKRACMEEEGEEPNLSEKYGRIEFFRIEALWRLVAAGAFASHSEKETLARGELARKYRIYAAGCRKRGKNEEANACETRAAGL
ncbi:MAG: glycosyltransferase family 2 protein [Spirochaetaceae bacterium]|nr:glycosyltransferase family 2 protein [Spirochaetaceae bacterium]